MLKIWHCRGLARNRSLTFSMKDARYAQDNNQHLAGFFQPDEKTEYQRLCIEYSIFPVFVGDSDADGSLRGDSLYPSDGAESDHCTDRCDTGIADAMVESLVVDVYESSVGSCLWL